MIRVRDRLIEYMARRMCAMENHHMNEGFRELHWKEYKPLAEYALDAINEFDKGNIDENCTETERKTA